MLNYLQDNYKLMPGNTDRKRRIIPVNGAVTAYVRKRLGIVKIRENGDLHHAVDAAVIAAVTQGVVNAVSKYSKRHELQYHVDSDGNCVDMVTGEIMDDAFKEKHQIKGFPEPWPHFRDELEARVSDNAAEAIRNLKLPTYSPDEDIKTPFVSRMVRHKTTGQAHEDTIRGVGGADSNIYIKKVALTELTLNKDHEIEGYYNPSSDRLLYEALKTRLEQFGGKGKDAFKEPFYKPKSKPKSADDRGPLVKTCKIMEKINLSVKVHDGKGITKNTGGSMVRVDVFKVRKTNGQYRYYLVPVYVSDTVKTDLPNRAVVGGKKYNEWPTVDDKDFLFSVYPNDLLYIGGKEVKLNGTRGDTLRQEVMTKDAFLYYKAMNISSGNIAVENHDDTYAQESLGIRLVPVLEKYEVSILGDLTKAKFKEREQFTMKSQATNRSR